MIADNKNDFSTQLWWQKPLALFGELSAWVGFPVIISLFLGRWLDQKYQTKPWLFLLTVSLAFIFSMYGIVRATMKSIKEIESSSKKNNSTDNSKPNETDKY
jgi:F0F1-type ATP synthase assembly protein I